jgi:hypothetical protein
MKRFRNLKGAFAAYWGGEMSQLDLENIKRQIEASTDFAAEFKALGKVVESVDAVGREMQSILAGIDWNVQAEKITASVWDAQPAPRKERKRAWGWTAGLRLKPVLAGLLIGIVMGGAGMFVAYKGGFFEKPKVETLFASREFLDRVDQEMARRETLDYLDKSQYVLLELAQSQSGSGDCRLSDAAARETRELLAKKKYLNPQLEKVRMAKAKDICDQIEMLFYELAQVSEGLTPAQCRGIQEMVEEKNILLKIKLLKKELQESEV